MTEPWDLTPAQRRQFREARAEAKRARAASEESARRIERRAAEEAARRMQRESAEADAVRMHREDGPEETGFGGWDLDRLTAQRDHLQSILLVSAGQSDRPQIREEYDAVCAEIAKRNEEG